ncbi:hypothetical protein [Streptomyces sp. NPDC050355]
MKAITGYVEACFDAVCISEIGPDQRGFVDFYRSEVLRQLSG